MIFARCAISIAVCTDPAHPARVDEQIAKAEQAVAGNTPVKRNRFLTLTEAEKSVNRDLEAKARVWVPN